MNTVTPDALKQWMKDTGTTQKRIAELLGINPATVNRWIKNRHPMREPEKKLLALLMFGKQPFAVERRIVAVK